MFLVVHSTSCCGCWRSVECYKNINQCRSNGKYFVYRTVTSALISGGGGVVNVRILVFFLERISFEINLITKKLVGQNTNIGIHSPPPPHTHTQTHTHATKALIMALLLCSSVRNGESWKYYVFLYVLAYPYCRIAVLQYIYSTINYDYKITCI